MDDEILLKIVLVPLDWHSTIKPDKILIVEIILDEPAHYYLAHLPKYSRRDKSRLPYYHHIVN